MAQIHNLESKSRFGTKYIAGLLLIISSLLIAGWLGFFVFLPIKSGMEVVSTLEEKFLPRAEGMVLDFVSLSEPSIIMTADNQLLDELHDGLNRDPIKLSEVMITEGSDNETKSNTIPSALGKNLSSRFVTTSIPDLIGKNIKNPNHPAMSKDEINKINPAIYLVPNLDLDSKLCICAMQRF